MIKSEIIALLARKHTQLSEKDIGLSINHILDQMSGSLGQGGRIEIRGFGSFCLHYRPPRNAHNPKTGDKVVTKAKHSPHFKPGKDMRERVNESRANVPIQADTDSDHDDGE